MEGRALPMVFSPSTCPLPLGSAARPRYYGFCWGLVADCKLFRRLKQNIGPVSREHLGANSRKQAQKVSH